MTDRDALLSARLSEAAHLLTVTPVLVASPRVIDTLEQLLRDLAAAALEHEHDQVVGDTGRAVADRYCNDELLAGALADALLEEREPPL